MTISKIELTPRLYQQMLFLWSRDPVPVPRTSPWLAWLATAVFIWRCRRRIANSILAVSPLRIFKRRTLAPVRIRRTISEPRPRLNLVLNAKPPTGIKTRVKRLCTGDGPHVSNSSTSSLPISYRVTRSGRVYGKYHHKVSLVKKKTVREWYQVLPSFAVSFFLSFFSFSFSFFIVLWCECIVYLTRPKYINDLFSCYRLYRP